MKVPDYPLRTVPGMLAVLLLSLVDVGVAQETFRQSFVLSPAVLAAESDQYTVGARWDWSASLEGGYRKDRFPRSVGAAFETTGTLALKPDHNPDQLRASAAGGLFVGLREPSRESPDPDEPNIGGFDFGSLFAGVQLGLESDQRFNEANSTLGAEVRYVNSMQSGLWPLVPVVHGRISAVLPLVSELRDRAGSPSESHARFDLNAVWHVPVLRTGFTIHADLLYWNAQRNEDEVAGFDTRNGLHSRLGLGYGLQDVTLGPIPIREVFVRWSGGELPVAPDHRRAWMIGIVTGSDLGAGGGGGP